MLPTEEYDLLTRIGPGTPCGDLMRRYWQPAALAEELLPGGPPLPIRLLGEDLVLFRDEGGHPGLLGLHCSHRGADLSYGRLEAGGLRCIYHGWLYDVHGRCLEQPGEPAGSTFHERIHHPAYPCREVGGLILTYLGPGEPPLVPAYDFLTAPDDRRFNTRVFQDCNYLQGNEGNIDPTHHSFLHLRLGAEDDTRWSFYTLDRAPILDAEETDFGVRVYAVRRVPGDRHYVKVSNFVLPNLSAITGDRDGYSVNWHVPIDDIHHWKYNVTFRRWGQLDHRARAGGRSPMTADYRLIRNKANRYQQDRDEMASRTFSGLGFDFQAQDTCVTEGAGPVQDRSQEHLGYVDTAIIAARRMLLRAIRDVQEGREPPHVVRDAARNDFSHIVARKEVLPRTAEWRNFWAREASSEIALDPVGVRA